MKRLGKNGNLCKGCFAIFFRASPHTGRLKSPQEIPKHPVQWPTSKRSCPTGNPQKPNQM